MGCSVLLVSGSLRSGSTNTAVLRTAQAVAPAGLRCVLYGGVGGLPHFNPDDDGDAVPAAVRELRVLVHGADVLLLCTPEYAGALPGSLKNLLEWLIGDDDALSIYRKPVAWINASPRGATEAHESLRAVLRYAHASLLDEVNAEIPVTSVLVGADGEIHDEGVRARIGRTMRALAESACGSHQNEAPHQGGHR
jgi:NAD(P)H-dependent FMN reductase